MYRIDVILLNRLNRFPVFSMSGFAYLLRLANRYYIQGNCVSTYCYTAKVKGYSLQENVLGSMSRLHVDIPDSSFTILAGRSSRYSANQENNWSLADGILPQSGPA
jgi:hypothetical protein